MIPMVFSRITLSALSTRFPQDPTFIRRMSWLWMRQVFNPLFEKSTYCFLHLPAPSNVLGVSIRRCLLSYLITAVTSTVVICLGRIFKRMFYYTFVNRFCDFHMLNCIKILLNELYLQ